MTNKSTITYIYILHTFKDGLAQHQKFTYSSVLHSHTVLMKLFPCGRHRQLNSVPLS